MGEEDKAEQALETFYIRSLKSMGLVMNHQTSWKVRGRPRNLPSSASHKAHHSEARARRDDRNWLLALGLIFLLLSLSLSLFFSRSSV